MYFKFLIEKFPLIRYEDILYQLNLKFPNLNKILFGKTKFNNLKNEIYREFNNNNNHNLNLIDNLELYGRKLLKEKFEYINEEGKTSIIRIYGTNETMSLLNSKQIIDVTSIRPFVHQHVLAQLPFDTISPLSHSLVLHLGHNSNILQDCIVHLHVPAQLPFDTI